MRRIHTLNMRYRKLYLIAERMYPQVKLDYHALPYDNLNDRYNIKSEKMYRLQRLMRRIQEEMNQIINQKLESMSKKPTIDELRKRHSPEDIRKFVSGEKQLEGYIVKRAKPSKVDDRIEKVGPNKIKEIAEGSLMPREYLERLWDKVKENTHGEKRLKQIIDEVNKEQ